MHYVTDVCARMFLSERSKFAFLIKTPPKNGEERKRGIRTLVKEMKELQETGMEVKRQE